MANIPPLIPGSPTAQTSQGCGSEEDLLACGSPLPEEKAPILVPEKSNIFDETLKQLKLRIRAVVTEADEEKYSPQGFDPHEFLNDMTKLLDEVEKQAKEFSPREEKDFERLVSEQFSKIVTTQADRNKEAFQIMYSCSIIARFKPHEEDSSDSTIEA